MLKLKDIINYVDTDDIELVLLAKHNNLPKNLFELNYNPKYNEHFIDFIHGSDNFNKITIQIKEKE